MSKHIHIHLNAAPKKTRDSASDLERRYKQIEKEKTALQKEIDKAEETGPESKVKTLESKYALLVKESAELRKKLNTQDSTDAPFPSYITFKGERYIKTGKTGKNFASGEEAAEYQLESYNLGKTKLDKRVYQTESGKITQDSAKVEDSEENDAYIKGHEDGIAGKTKDPEYHPGGKKKPSVALKYAEGHLQGQKDRKRK